MTTLPSTVILMYHGIGRPDPSGNCSEEQSYGFYDKYDLPYVIDTPDFTKQITCIAQKGIPVFIPGEPAGNRSSIITAGSSKFPSRVVLTFDDGHRSDHSIALPLLNEFGLKAVFFITTDWIGRDGFMTTEMIRELHSAGMTIGSHGCSHVFFPDVTYEKAYDELKRSKEILEEITNVPIDSFSAPGGRINNRTVETAKALGYKWIYNSKPIVNSNITPWIPLGRFSVKRGKGTKWFTKIISATPPTSEMTRYRFLLCIKKLLGNRRYERIRSMLLK